MADSRKAELEAKKAKLAELRRAREQRTLAAAASSRVQSPVLGIPASHDVLEIARRESPVRMKEDVQRKSVSVSTAEQVILPQTLPEKSFMFGGCHGSKLRKGRSERPMVDDKDGLDQVQEELGGTPPTKQAKDESVPSMKIGMKTQEPTFVKQVQTMDFEHSERSPSPEIVTRPEFDRDAETDPKPTDESGSIQPSTIEKEMTAQERAMIVDDQDFDAFLGTSSRIIQRALQNDYDITRDYTAPPDQSSLDENQSLHFLQTCSTEADTLGRCITDLDWSTQHIEVCAASYTKKFNAVDEQSGLVAIWNVHMPQKPEYLFNAQSDVLTIKFFPNNPQLLVGSTYSGQINIWDMRAKRDPILSSSPMSKSHTHPVYSLCITGSHSLNTLVTASTDGMVCSWSLEMLAQPREIMNLTDDQNVRNSEVAVTSIAFKDNVTTQFFAGSEQGCIYNVSNAESATAKAGIVHDRTLSGHTAPVTSIDCHPSRGPLDFSDYLLSSAMDSTVKLWHTGQTNGSNALVTSFEAFDDYVSAVHWHPCHPAIFGSVTCSGRFDLWNLNHSVEVSKQKYQVSNTSALNAFAWHGKAPIIALADIEGKITLLKHTLEPQSDQDWLDLRRSLQAD